MAARTSHQIERLPALLSWLAIFTAAAASIAVLHALGANEAFSIEWGDVWGWLGAHSAERVLLALGRLVALALAYWIGASLVVYTLARATRLPGLIRSVEWLTLPTVRRVADRAVAITLAVSTLTAGGTGAALASDAPIQDVDPQPVVQIQSQESPSAGSYIPVPAGDTPILPTPTAEDTDNATDTTYTPTPAGSETVPVPIASSAPSREAPPHNFDPSAAESLGARAETRLASMAYDYGVVAGDNLWLVAERHLISVLDRAPSEAETATYWAHLVEANRPGLRSGNPDLIFPGEIVVCPPTTDVGLGR